MVLPTCAARRIKNTAELVFWIDHRFNIYKVQVENFGCTLAHQKELRSGLQHNEISFFVWSTKDGIPGPSILHALQEVEGLIFESRWADFPFCSLSEWLAYEWFSQRHFKYVGLFIIKINSKESKHALAADINFLFYH